MAFISFEFIVFLIVVFAAYWLLKKSKWQNGLILVASYFFYSYWDWRFLSLIVLSSIIDFLIGIELGKASERLKRKTLLIFSLLSNLGILFVFKYFNFFSKSLQDAAQMICGVELSNTTLNIVLPVGISFYTFQTLSYTIDVYRRQMQPTKDFISFFAYVSFFPQLVAGPIERATNLLPQFQKERLFNYEKGKDGLRQILWGIFKKVVIADNLGTYLDVMFLRPENFSGSELVLGSVFFSFQIYCDFSAYSDIAIGSAKLFGFDLIRNFNFPYFSRDISEFWRRWHISLSTWFRDYVYIPLGGSHSKFKARLFSNVLIVFLLSAIWHGANWTFITWGLIHATIFLPYILTGSNRKYLGNVAEGKVFAHVREIAQMIVTFSLVTFSWIFFRAASIQDALAYLNGIFSPSLFSVPSKAGGIPLIMLLVVIEWLTRQKRHPFENWQFKYRWGVYILVLFLITFFTGEDKVFIYFQF